MLLSKLEADYSDLYALLVEFRVKGLQIAS